jgi:molybdopterin-synthase adenylyltransferase
MNERYARQSFLGPRSEKIFTHCRACIIGLGGGGSHVAQQLAHVGVGNFLIFDADHVEDSNLNRLVGATQADVISKTPKTVVATRLIQGINPKAQIVARLEKWQESAALLRDADVIFGCVDSFSERQQIEATARRYLIPYIDIGMDVHDLGGQFAISGQVILSMPGELCMKCMGFLREDLLAHEAANYGAAGSKPQVIWPNGVLASLAVGIFVPLMTPWHRNHRRVWYLEYDGNSQTVATSNRLAHLAGTVCNHFSSLEDLGDPFWKPSNLKVA